MDLALPEWTKIKYDVSAYGAEAVRKSGASKSGKVVLAAG